MRTSKQTKNQNKQGVHAQVNTPPLRRPHPRTVGDALLDLEDCLTDPSKTRHLIHALGSWLANENSAETLPAFEAHSETLWKRFNNLAQSMRGENAPQTLQSWYFDRSLMPLKTEAHFCLYAEDTRRLKAWLKTDRQSVLLVRLYDEPLLGDSIGEGPSLALIRGLDKTEATAHPHAVGRCEPVATGLAEVVENLLIEAYGITPKQMAVLRYLVLGLRVPEIAAALEINESSVRTHQNRLADKLGVAGQNEILATMRLVEKGALAMAQAEVIDQAGEVLRLKDGSNLGYASYGPATGRPLIYLHGFLTGRHLPRSIEKVLTQSKIRLIAPCRPGVGPTTLKAKTAAEYCQQVVSNLADLIESLGLFYAGPTPLIADGSGLIYALAFARAHPSLCRLIMALDPLPPLKAEDDLQKFHGLFQKAMVLNFKSRPLFKTMLQLACLDTQAQTTPKAFFEAHYFRDTSTSDLLPGPADLEARWKNVRENLSGQFEHLIFDADLIKTDFTYFPKGCNLHPKVAVLQTDHSPYLVPGAVESLAESLEADYIPAGPSMPYVEGQMPLLAKTLLALS